NRELIALLPLLKSRYRLLLGSNTNELHTRQFRRQFEQALQHFDALVFSHEIGARKPVQAFFEHCQRHAGCSPKACLFIDDMPANVSGAEAWGWNAFVYRGMDDLRARFAGLGIEMSSELPQINAEG